MASTPSIRDQLMSAASAHLKNDKMPVLRTGAEISAVAGAAPTPAQLTAIEDAVKEGRIPALTPAATELAKSAVTVAAVLDFAGAATMTSASSGRALIMGATMRDVIRQFFIALAQARATAHARPLIEACVMAVGLAFTVARDWVPEYAALPAGHPFASFEVTRRNPSAPVEGEATARDAWVRGSNMNATAVRALGMAIVIAAQDGGFLADVRKKAGTVLNPPPESDTSERAVLMREAAKTLTAEDKAALTVFASTGKKLIAVVDAAFGAASGDYETANRIVSAMPDHLI